MEEKVIAQGRWCTACNYFEEWPEDHPNGTCMSCGCAVHKHLPVKVVAT